MRGEVFAQTHQIPPQAGGNRGVAHGEGLSGHQGGRPVVLPSGEMTSSTSTRHSQAQAASSLLLRDIVPRARTGGKGRSAWQFAGSTRRPVKGQGLWRHRESAREWPVWHMRTFANNAKTT